MRRTIRKWFWAWDFEKEERWLNDMAARGLALVAVSVCKYTFEDSDPGEYNVRLELLNKLPSSVESSSYIGFVEETGAEYLGSLARWAYFRKRADAEEFNLFSDNASRVRHMNRLLVMLWVAALAQIPASANNIHLYFAYDARVNGVLGLLCVLLGLLCGYGILRLSMKIRRLKKEQRIFE